MKASKPRVKQRSSAQASAADRAVAAVRRRPDRDHYFMAIAIAVRARANCLGSRIGAVLVLDDRVVSTGYNGTPEDMKNCDEGGCDRCLNREKYGSGKAYDVCICVHAEQNALLTAARFGIPTTGSVLYTTTRPCFGCTKELLQANVQAVYFLHDWTYPDPALHAEYEKIQNRIPKGIRKVDMGDPDTDWARGRGLPVDTGHTIPRPASGNATSRSGSNSLRRGE
jgi:dCMP deaminase